MFDCYFSSCWRLSSFVSLTIFCFQGHPTEHTLLASSGLEQDVYLWSPVASVENSMERLQEVVEENQVRKRMS